MINSCFSLDPQALKAALLQSVLLFATKGSVPQNVMSVPYINGIKNTRNDSVSN